MPLRGSSRSAVLWRPGFIFGSAMQSASSWSSRHCFFYMSELRNGPHRIMTGLTSTRCWKNLTAVQPTVLTEECGPVTSFVVKFAVDSLLEGDGFGGDASSKTRLVGILKGGTNICASC